MDTVVNLPSLEALRSYVRATLCAHDELDPTGTPLYEALLTRAGRKVGLFFQVQGPRRVRTYAIWAGEEGRLLFYDSCGLRFAEVRLGECPDPLRYAA